MVTVSPTVVWTLEQVLETVDAIATQIHQCADLDVIFDGIVQETRELFQCDRVLIDQIAADGTGIIAAESVAIGCQPLLGSAIDACLHDRWLDLHRLDQTCNISDVATADLLPCQLELLTQLQVSANLVVPIRVHLPALVTDPPAKTTVWGWFIAHQCNASRTWQPIETTALKHIATQIALALQHSDRQYQRRHQEITVTNNPATILHPSATLLKIPPQKPLHTPKEQQEANQQTVCDRAAMLHKLAAQIPGVIYQYHLHPNGHSCFPYASEAIRQIYEVTPEQVRHSADLVLQRLHPDDAAAVTASIQTSFQTLQLWHQEYRVILPQQGLRWLEGHATPEKLPDGSVLWHGYIWDITERKQAESLLQLQSTALQACADGIMITDCQGTIEWVNPAFTKLTGYPLAEAQGNNPRDLIKSGFQDRTFYQHLWQTILNGNVWRGEIVNRRKDGSFFTEAATITPVANHHGEISHFVAIKQDITDRKHSEKAFQQRTEQERLITKITQDIRQSLNLHQILSTTVTEVRHFLHTDRVIVYRLNPDWTGMVLTESVAPEWHPILNMEIIDTCIVETQAGRYNEHYIYAIDDVDAKDFSPCYRQLLEALQIRAKLVVPILQGEQPWGLLIAHHCSAPRRWQPFEGELLLQLAAQLAIAIQQSELHQQVQQLNTHLEAQVQQRTAQLQQSLEFEALLKRITDKVRDSLDEQQILQTVVRELAHGLNIEACDTGIYDTTHTTSTIAYEFTKTIAAAQGVCFAIADAPHLEVYPHLLRGQTCHFCDVIPNSLRSNQQLFTVLACPIVDEQTVLGDLWLFKPPSHTFNDLEIRLVQQVANHCAIALRQSRLYRAAQAQVEEFARLNQLKDDFLNTVSHELRTPIASIQMAIRMLEISLQPTGLLTSESNRISRYFQILQTECQRETALITDLLDLARIDSGTEPLRLTPVNLSLWLPHLVEPFAERAHNHSQHLEISLPDPLPSITTDLPYLERVMTELLHNACKYTPTGENITVTIKPIAASDQYSNDPTRQSILIEISNSGVEIAPSERDRIFDKFYRIPNNDPWKHGGTGLGLALVKKLIGCIGGTITVSSQPHWVTFTITLPDCPL